MNTNTIARLNEWVSTAPTGTYRTTALYAKRCELSEHQSSYSFPGSANQAPMTMPVFSLIAIGYGDNIDAAIESALNVAESRR